MINLLSPITSLAVAKKVINAGATEVYCGVDCPSIEYPALSTRHRICSLPDYDELEKVVTHAHNNNTAVLVTTEFPFISREIEEEILKHILSCVETDIDGLILGDIGLILSVKKMDLDVPIHASTYLASMNYEAVALLTELGVERIILERNVSIEEIAEIKRRSRDVEIEVFVHGPGCSNININCYGCYIPQPLVMKAYMRSQSRPQQKMGAYLTPMCKLVFDIYRIKGQKLKQLKNDPVLDAYHWCSLCKLPEILDTRIDGVKIVGRCLSPEYQVETTRIYRELINLIEHDQIDSFNKALPKKEIDKIALIAPKMIEICEQERCYYSPFFHAPYKTPMSPKLADEWRRRVSNEVFSSDG